MPQSAKFRRVTQRIIPSPPEQMHTDQTLPDTLSAAPARLLPADFDRRMLTHVVLRQLAMIDHPDAARSADADRFIQDFRDRFLPRDVMEEMMLAQLLLTHVRIMQLCHLASQSRDVFDVTQAHIYANKAVECFENQLNALYRYRRPPLARHPTSPSIFQTTPIFENEKGLPDEKTPLPPDIKGLTIAPSRHPEEQTMDHNPRPQIPDGQEVSSP